MENRLTWCLNWIDTIRNEMSSLNKDRVEALKLVNSDPSIVPYIEGRSKLTTSDVLDEIERIKPDIFEIFAGNEQITSIQPQEELDTEAAKRLEILVNKQLYTKNNWYMIINDIIDDALKMKLGAVKITWQKESKYIDKIYNGLTDEEYIAKILQPDTEVLEHEEIFVTNETNSVLPVSIKQHNLKLRYIVNDEYPKLEPVPAEKIGFPIRTRDIQEAPFIYHICTYPKWQFKKIFGDKAIKVDEYLENYQEINEVDEQRYKEYGSPLFMYDRTSDEYIVYECHYREPETGELKITHICGNKELLTEDNTYGKYPFRVLTPIKLAHTVIGLSVVDLLKDIQKKRTALIRQIYDNIYLANSRRYFVDPSRINLDDYLNNTSANSVIRTVGDPNGCVLPEMKAPLPGEVFSFWELLNMEKDYHGIAPRSYQGVNANVLNKTFRGQNQQIAQASKKLLMMARLFAEMFFKPLVCDVIDLNLRFLSKKTQIRYLNDWIEVNPDNIVGKYDVIVNVGLGMGNKDQTIVYMQQLLGLYAQIYKSGIPVVTAQNAYNALKELIKAMGYQNTSDFITDPKITQIVPAFVMQALQGMNTLGIQDKNMQDAAIEILSDFGALPKQQGVNASTYENQETPAQPNNPMQPNNPTTVLSGDGYYA